MPSVFLPLRNRAIVVLMLGHFTNDMYGGVLAILYPLMKLRFGLSNAEIGLVTLCYTGVSSVTQPLFGHLADRHFRRWFAPATILWGTVIVSLYGFAPSFAAFVALAGLAGAASGAFHPIGASNAAMVSDDSLRNGSMSLYTVAGSSGYAVGPLIATLLLGLFGAPGTAYLLVPGTAVALLLLRQMRVVERVRQARASVVGTGNLARPAWGLLARVIGVTMLRSWVYLSVLQFIPIWFDSLGYPRAFYGPLTTAMILAGAVGTLLGGMYADRVGQRRIVVVTLALVVPFLLLFVRTPGPASFVFAPLMGMASDASLSVTLVMAQRLVPGRVGVASGAILGLGFVTGGIGVPVTGAIADRVGIEPALASLALLAIAAVLLATTLPSEAQMERRMAVGPEDEPLEAGADVSAPAVPAAG